MIDFWWYSPKTSILHRLLWTFCKTFTVGVHLSQINNYLNIKCERIGLPLSVRSHQGGGYGPSSGWKEVGCGTSGNFVSEISFVFVRRRCVFVWWIWTALVDHFWTVLADDFWYVYFERDFVGDIPCLETHTFDNYKTRHSTPVQSPCNQLTHSWDPRWGSAVWRSRQATSWA